MFETYSAYSLTGVAGQPNEYSELLTASIEREFIFYICNGYQKVSAKHVRWWFHLKKVAKEYSIKLSKTYLVHDMKLWVDHYQHLSLVYSLMDLNKKEWKDSYSCKLDHTIL